NWVFSTTGQKRDLQERLIQHYDLSGNRASDEEFNQSVYEDVGGTTNLRSSPLIVQQQQFTLKDLGDCVNVFSGEGSVDIRGWVSEFENNAEIVKWNDLQRFVYGKQLLRGAAKLFVRSQNNLNSWEALKLSLINEFGRKLSSADVHRLLKNRRKQANETFREYLYHLMEVGKQISLDEESIIDYFIEGVPDTKFNKAILYQAKNIEELKEQIKIYEKIRKYNSGIGKIVNDTSSNKTKEELGKRCFKCGDKFHVAAQCPQKQYKCFKCNEMGHRSFECKNNKVKGAREVKIESSSINTLGNTSFQPVVDEELHFKTVNLNGFRFEALIDSGCSLNLIRYDTLILSGLKPILSNEKRKLYSACSNVIETIGSFDTFIHIDELVLKVRFHVVREQDIKFASMIGKAILKDVDIVLTEDKVMFKKKDNSRDYKPGNDKMRQDSKQVMKEERNAPIEAKNKWIKEFDAMSLNERKDETTVNLGHLSKGLAKEVKSLVDKYKSSGKCISPVKMEIVLTDEIPVYQRPRRLPIDDRSFVDKQIEDWLKEGIIQPSSSNYASPVVVVPKKDGNRRLCCDYRQLNKKIVRDNFPMVVMDDVLDSLQEGRVFTTLDLSNGFFHVPVDSQSRKFTAFVTHNGQYEFCVVPFGISNSPAVFCRYVNAVFPATNPE
ncbi:uncharacterized protein LOC125780300, partial [Bactrocera dorsalis]|uniref:Uncharacterized protein LOC125780300 n=1 Tax=Bactrocera dorsalis TaxID=27457 RepID=A0ABM3K9T9_BACDO